MEVIMIKNVRNICVAKEILILHHENIIKEAKNQSIELELKKLKKVKKRQYKKNLKNYLDEE